MFSKQVELIINTLMLIEGCLVIAAGYLAYVARWVMSDGIWSMNQTQFIGSVLFLMFVNNFLMGRFGLYSDRRAPSFWYILQRLTAVVCLNFALLSIAYFTLNWEDISRLFIGYYAIILFILFVAERAGFELFLNKRQETGFSATRVLLVGSDHRAAKVLKALLSQRSWGHQVLGFVLPHHGAATEISDVPCLGALEDLESVLTEQAVDDVVFALSENNRDVDLKTAIASCETLGVTYRIVPAMFDATSQGAMHVENLLDIPVLAVNTVRINPTGLMYKRVLDYTFGLAGFLVFLLCLPFVAVAIKLDSPGPVFFRQPRMGQHGRVFRIFKFRTMFIDAEARKKELMQGNEMNGQMFKMADDPRITRVGKFLRKASLDELPQVLNVLAGEMSIVGTRPPTLDEVDGYEQWHRRRIAIKPGITGMWQISGRNKITDFNEVVQLDLKYIDHWRFWHDLQIIWSTFWIVLRRKGAC